ncbi:hypothetical protein HMN09_00537800 [Mycena chlorophos]|uniref:C2H2-type domain-containing protein n=1 Tax=Mycena chlorophos TaxID=658473 RepID=A0A8H6T7Z9_MYCCL|nr:hypothetical protein HMN09_00537800 [Mycena chlorophos]
MIVTTSATISAQSCIKGGHTVVPFFSSDHLIAMKTNTPDSPNFEYLFPPQYREQDAVSLQLEHDGVLASAEDYLDPILPQIYPGTLAFGDTVAQVGVGTDCLRGGLLILPDASSLRTLPFEEPRPEVNSLLVSSIMHKCRLGLVSPLVDSTDSRSQACLMFEQFYGDLESRFPNVSQGNSTSNNEDWFLAVPGTSTRNTLYDLTLFISEERQMDLAGPIRISKSGRESAARPDAAKRRRTAASGRRKGQFSCDWCKATFCGEYEKRRHQECSCPNRPDAIVPRLVHECERCGRQFTRRCSLLRHLRGRVCS